MKKNFLVIISIFSICLLVGCGGKSKEEVINCNLKMTETGNNYTIESKYTIYGKDDVVTKVSTTEIVESEDTEILDYFEEYLTSTYSDLNDTYSGYDFKITKKEGKVTSVVNIDYSAVDMDKYVENNTAMQSYVNKDNKLTVEKAKLIYESLGATCE